MLRSFLPQDSGQFSASDSTCKSWLYGQPKQCGLRADAVNAALYVLRMHQSLSCVFRAFVENRAMMRSFAPCLFARRRKGLVRQAIFIKFRLSRVGHYGTSRRDTRCSVRPPTRLACLSEIALEIRSSAIVAGMERGLDAVRRLSRNPHGRLRRLCVVPIRAREFMKRSRSSA